MRSFRFSPVQIFCTTVLVVIGLTTLAAVIPVDHSALRGVANYAPYMSIAFFGTGLVALLMSRQSLMKGSFVCAAVLSVMLRSSTVNVEADALVLEAESSATFEVAQLTADNLQPDASGLQVLLGMNANAISVHGLTPDWSEFLGDTLAALYPYQYVYEDLGLQGIGLYSKIPVGTVDTVHVGGAVHLEACISGDDHYRELSLVGVQTIPPVNSSAYFELRAQLSTLADRVNDPKVPTIVMGDFNSVPWSNEMYDFQRDSKLLESRKSVQSTFVKGAPQFFEVPVEHIFYTESLRCLHYQTLRVGSRYVGSCATFEDRAARPKLASL